MYAGSELGMNSGVTGTALGLSVRRNSVGLPPTKSPFRNVGTYILSPRDVINSGNRQNSDESPMSGYYAQSTVHQEHNSAPYIIKGKNADMRNIEKDAVRKAKIPAPDHYKLKSPNNWDGKDTLNKNPDGNMLPREVRNTPADLAVIKASRKELSTPGPGTHRPNFRLVEPRELGGYSGMNLEPPTTEKKMLKSTKKVRDHGTVPVAGIQDDAIARAQEIPGVG